MRKLRHISGVLHKTARTPTQARTKPTEEFLKLQQNSEKREKRRAGVNCVTLPDSGLGSTAGIAHAR